MAMLKQLPFHKDKDVQHQTSSINSCKCSLYEQIVLLGV